MDLGRHEITICTQYAVLMQVAGRVPVRLTFLHLYAVAVFWFECANNSLLAVKQFASTGIANSKESTRQSYRYVALQCPSSVP